MISKAKTIRVAVNGPRHLVATRDRSLGVIPETIDAIRALTGIETTANESIARTNAALGIEAPFM